MGVVSHPPPSYSKDDDHNYLFNQLDGNISLDSSLISTDDLNDPNASCAYPELHEQSIADMKMF